MNPLSVEVVAWASVVICLVVTVHCAITYARKDPRLFSCLVFFALCWGVLLPYYGLMHLRQEWKSFLSPDDFKKFTEIIELFPAYSGLLLTLAGGPLRREAAIRHKGHHDPGIGEPDVWVLRALYLMAVPHILAIAPLGVSINVNLQLLRALGVAFTYLGFYSILQGLRELTQSRVWRALVGVVFLYIIAEAGYTAYVIPQMTARTMPDIFKLIFAALKLAFTLAFLYTIVRETRHFRLHKARGAVPN